MYTHCPNCDTHFEISQEYLDIANGKVRCGKCDHIFNALDNLYEKKTEASDSAPTEQLSQLQNNLSDNINQLSTSPEEAETIETPPPSTFKDAATDLPGNSIERSNNEGFSIGGISSKSSGSDIKEKMERIAASLSAATAELKNARKSTTFHKHSTDSILSQETVEPVESSEIQ
ncbi:MAG: zinc-ribbon domain-containing protein, partial [Gammaproteobacteria bacterium]|nr:zinc-ribbon domain-containing protein [Gammaproteobacteria bacterium]